MSRFLLAITAAAVLSVGATAQTSAQATGTVNSGANVQAGQTNANVNSSTSADADAQTNRKNRNAEANGTVGTENSASVNGNSVNAGSSSGSTLAAGTTIPATLNKPVDARKAKPGDEVAARTTQDVRSESGVVIPRGSRLVGHVTQADAKAKGDTESSLGIVFDRAVLRNGRQVPLNASIRAVAAAANTTSAAMDDDSFASSGASAIGASAAAPGRGGLLGGTGSAVGSATGAVSGAAGGVSNGVANTAGSVGGNAGAAVSGTGLGAAGQLTSQSQGVIGLKGLSLDSAASNSTQGSIITSTGKDVKLDSGTQMLLQVNRQ
jgi:hypothetical protein